MVYILDPAIDPDGADAKLERLHGLAIAGAGRVEAVDHWGPRTLCYPIKGQSSGYYVVAHLKAEPEALPEFERLLRLDEEVLRYLLVVNQGEGTAGASKMGKPRYSDEPGPALETATTDEAGEDGGGEAEDPDEGDEDNSASEDQTSLDAADEPEAEPGPAEPRKPTASPGSGPPEFSGPGGRRRRAEGPPILLLDYKDVEVLSYFITDQGKILPKRLTRVPARLQRQLGRAIKRARYLALIPYTGSFDH